MPKSQQQLGRFEAANDYTNRFTSANFSFGTAIMQRLLLLSIAMLLLLAACRATPSEENSYATVIENTMERTFTLPYPMTVEEFLGQANILWDENDRIVPPLYTQVTNGTRITIVRVDEVEECEMEVIPFQDQRIPNQGFEEGEERIQRQG